jgi:tetratricopeptide (TPR) repeat protein
LSRSRNHGYLAAVLATRGEVLVAKRELNAAATALDEHGEADGNFRARIAIAMARLGAMTEAQAQLSKLTSTVGANESARLHVLGEIATARGKSREAVRLLERALAAAPDPAAELLIRYSIARAAEAVGDRDQAIDVYRELASVPLGRWIGWEAQEMQQLAALALARLYMARGDAALARVALARIQADWRGADADLPPARELRRLTAELAMSRGAQAPERFVATQAHAPAETTPERF